jgi:CSLREA domain-containing protein
MKLPLELSRHLAGFAAVLAFTCLPAAQAQPAGTPGATIVVNSLADGNVIVFPGDPLPCTLRDAIQAANTNRAVRGCVAGLSPHYVSASPLRIDFVDRIVFSAGTGTPRIQLQSGLPKITEAVTIDGATGGATRIEIAGSHIPFFGFPVSGLVVTGTDATLKSLVINGFRGHGIALTHDDVSGLAVTEPPSPERPAFQPGSLPGDPCGPRAFPADPNQCPPAGGSSGGVPPVPGDLSGGGNTVLDCLIGTDATGTKIVGNGDGTAATAGIAILSPGNLIGGTARGAGNLISGHRGRGVLFDGRNNKVSGNSIGTLSNGVVVGNQLDGVFVAGGQYATADGEIRSNTIAGNGGNGVDAGYNNVAILSNRIFANGGLGIERAEAGVTANDPTGLRTRPPNVPLLQASTATFPAGTTIFGQIMQSSPGPITLEFFYSPSCDPSGNGEGSSFIGSTTVAGGRPTLFQFQTSNIFLQGSFTATATTASGTSELSACLR